MRLGSFCTGIGRLDEAVAAVTGARPMWFSEIDYRANEVLMFRYPDVTNLGDFTAVDEFPDVDVLCVGFPCQPVSTAGMRKGVDDERWLFDDILAAVGRMGTRPVLFLENVPGLLVANRGAALARVVEGLAAIGYVGSYGLLSASAVGACHRRLRWFCIARPEGQRFEGSGIGDGTTQPDCETLESWIGDDRHSEVDWGRYGPAIRRHETIFGPAPRPVRNGALNDRFVEWMMMVPAGFVTDILGRTAALKALGNSVVTPQAIAAYSALLGIDTHTHTCAADDADTTDLGQQRGRDARHRRDGPADRLPTPTAWLGRRPSHATGDPMRWADPARSSELSDFVAAHRDLWEQTR